MGTERVSVTLDADLVAAAKSELGEQGFSRYLDEALRGRLWRRPLALLVPVPRAKYHGASAPPDGVIFKSNLNGIPAR
jgi:hypothetical protein